MQIFFCALAQFDAVPMVFWPSVRWLLPPPNIGSKNQQTATNGHPSVLTRHDARLNCNSLDVVHKWFLVCSVAFQCSLHCIPAKDVQGAGHPGERFATFLFFFFSTRRAPERELHFTLQHHIFLHSTPPPSVNVILK